ncbi:hypothetical protein B0H17DRAFT_1129079 [Mycena rosella]|uniref:Uncharacterized protein n=1 Tax=Mycena rosella TaxID=1033263 RepID=A0AAD7DUI7_MYCRO|nr:hypothetical protein B0H17DRAFT_1129079 [Mycena rosella]
MPFVHAVYRRRTVLLRRQFYADQLTAVAPDLTCTHSMQVIFRQPTVIFCRPTVSLGGHVQPFTLELTCVISVQVIFADRLSAVAPDLTCIHSTQIISHQSTSYSCTRFTCVSFMQVSLGGHVQPFTLELTCIVFVQVIFRQPTVISRHPTVSGCAWLYFLYAGNFPPPDCQPSRLILPASILRRIMRKSNFPKATDCFTRWYRAHWPKNLLQIKVQAGGAIAPSPAAPAAAGISAPENAGDWSFNEPELEGEPWKAMMLARYRTSTAKERRATPRPCLRPQEHERRGDCLSLAQPRSRSSPPLAPPRPVRPAPAAGVCAPENADDGLTPRPVPACPGSATPPPHPALRPAPAAGVCGPDTPRLPLIPRTQKTGE